MAVRLCRIKNISNVFTTVDSDPFPYPILPATVMPRSTAIVIIRVNQLGDNLIFLPVVSRILAMAGDAPVHLLTSKLAAPLYQGLLPDGQIHAVDTLRFYRAWRNPFRLLAYTRHLRSLRPGAVLVGEDQGNSARFMAACSGASVRVGRRDPKSKTNGCLTCLVDEEPGEHVAEFNWRIARAFAEQMDWPTQDWEQNLPRPELSHLDLSCGEGPVSVVIHAGASRKWKAWPLERYVALANKLATDLQVCWIHQGAPGEECLDAAVEHVHTPTVARFLAEVARGVYFIGNNSAGMHMASALDMHGLIFGGHEQARWDPYWGRSRFHVLRARSDHSNPAEHANLDVSVEEAEAIVRASLTSIERGVSAS